MNVALFGGTMSASAITLNAGARLAISGSAVLNTGSITATNWSQVAFTSGTLNLTGCAQSQKEVAVTLVRLRQINGASDVSLKQSSATENQGGSSGGDSASGGSGACAAGEYQFQASVTLTKQDSGSASSKVPASLGGGS